MKEVKLDEILDKVIYDSDTDRVGRKQILLAMKIACKQTLELAAENAYVQDWYMNGELVGKAVNKQSILDLINQIK